MGKQTDLLEGQKNQGQLTPRFDETLKKLIQQVQDLKAQNGNILLLLESVIEKAPHGFSAEMLRDLEKLTAQSDAVPFANNLINKGKIRGYTDAIAVLEYGNPSTAMKLAIQKISALRDNEFALDNMANARH